MSFLTTKYGPLPAWGWGAVAGGGLLLLKAKGGGKAKSADPNDPNSSPQGQGAGAPPSSQAFMYGGSGNNYADQTFGGGSLGFYGYPYGGGGNMFVNLHRHNGDWHHGGHGYPFHAFDRHPFFNFGGLFGNSCKFCKGKGCDRCGGGKHDFRGFGDKGRNDGDRDRYQHPGSPNNHFGPGGDGGRASRWADNNASSQGNHVN